MLNPNEIKLKSINEYFHRNKLMEQFKNLQNKCHIYLHSRKQERLVSQIAETSIYVSRWYLGKFNFENNHPKILIRL